MDNKKSLLDRIIYTDETRKEIAILQDFEIDVDVAKQKDFQIKVPADESKLKAGYYWFVQDEEYGGIIDEVLGNSADNEASYKGRNARGILATKIVEPLQRGLRVVSGSIPAIFNELIQLCELDELYIADEIDSPEIINFPIGYYADLYQTLVDIALSVNCTIKLSYSSVDSKWHIRTKLIEDYSDFLNYCQDNSVRFETDMTVNAVNHLICVNEAGYVIHLYTDKNGGLQRYQLHNNPIEDNDYILDNRNQKLFGLDEYAKVVNVNSQVTENYKKVKEIPDDWQKVFAQYFFNQVTFNKTQDKIIQENKDYYYRYGEKDNYIYMIVESPIQSELDLYYEMSSQYVNYSAEGGEDVYTRISSQPEDWDKYTKTADLAVNIGKHYFTLEDDEFVPVAHPVTSEISEYYEYTGQFNKYYDRMIDEQGTESYISIEGVARDNFVPLGNVRPDDWFTRFSSYYEKIEDVFIPAQSIVSIVYGLQTEEPEDWGNSYNLYFTIVDGAFVPVQSVMKEGEETYPTWRKNKYYTRLLLEEAPAWEDNKYYWNDVMTVAPEFNVVYEKTTTGKVPVYQPDNTYETVLDHYASLVEAGLNELDNIRATQKQEVKLDEFEVEIGDIVGGEDRVTGYTITEPVTNIIAKLNKQGISIEYSVGGE